MKVVLPEPAIPMHRMTGGRLAPDSVVLVDMVFSFVGVAGWSYLLELPVEVKVHSRFPPSIFA